MPDPIPVDPRRMDVRRQLEIEKVKAQYQRIMEMSTDIEKLGRKHKFTLAEMDQAWDAYVKRQNAITAKRMVEETEPMPLQIIENGQRVA